MGKVTYNQSGYVGCSMSERAVAAYNDGEKPKSRWTKRAMLDAIETYCEEQGIGYDKGASALKRDEIFDRFFEWKSWHHTGKYANETDFYGIDEDAVWDAFGKEQK